jgi:hypothetical protein
MAEVLCRLFFNPTFNDFGMFQLIKNWDQETKKCFFSFSLSKDQFNIPLLFHFFLNLLFYANRLNYDNKSRFRCDRDQKYIKLIRFNM